MASLFGDLLAYSGGPAPDLNRLPVRSPGQPRNQTPNGACVRQYTRGSPRLAIAPHNESSVELIHSSGVQDLGVRGWGGKPGEWMPSHVHLKRGSRSHPRRCARKRASVVSAGSRHHLRRSTLEADGQKKAMLSTVHAGGIDETMRIRVGWRPPPILWSRTSGAGAARLALKSI